MEQSENLKNSTNLSTNSQSTIESCYVDEYKEIENLIQENRKLEETIIVLKPTRYSLSVSLEDLKDEFNELKSITKVLICYG